MLLECAVGMADGITAGQAPSLEKIARSRIATCIVGAARTLLLRGVHESIKRNLLESQLVPVDLFLHLHLGWDNTVSKGVHGSPG